MRTGRPGIALVSTIVAATLCGCQVEQVPAGGQPFVALELGERYLVLATPAGRPLGIWDLASSTVERSDLEADPDADVTPVRLVNFADPGEMEAILDAEGWRFGVSSFFAGAVTLGILKYTMTTELFDVRENREASRAMLRQTLVGRGPDDPALRRLGLDGDRYRSALDQLALVEDGRLLERAVRNERRLGRSARQDLLELLDEVEERAAAAVADDPAAVVGASEAIDGFESILHHAPSGRSWAAIAEAVGRIRAVARQAPIAVDSFGEGNRLALARAWLGWGWLSIGIYDLAVDDDGPARLLALCSALIPPEASEGLTLAAGGAGAVLLTGATYGLGTVVGFPFPVLGVLLNLLTSIRPTLPFMEQDPLAPSRGALLVLLAEDRDDLPPIVAGQADRIARRLELEMIAGNRFWLAPDTRMRLADRNRLRLRAAAASSRESLEDPPRVE